MRWLVTGAGRGIGRELARGLVERRHEVIATVRDDRAAAEVTELGARVERWDAEVDGDERRLAERLAGVPIDVLVANAGTMGEHEALGRIARANVERVFRIDAAAQLALVQALLPNLRAGTAKRVVAVTSRMGSIADNSSGGSYAYRAAKAALNAMVKSLSIDLADEGFVCVVVHPGWVRTAMGGPTAPLAPETSAAKLLDIATRLDARDNGGFFGPDGEELPW